jgi:hypothetical protein
MGAIADALVTGAKDLFSNVAAKSESAGVTRLGKDTVFAQESEFSRSPEAMKFGARMGDYDFKRQQILADLYKPVNAVHEAVKNDPAQSHATIGKINADLTNSKHSAAVHTQELINREPENQDLTLKAYSAKLDAQARLLAQKSLGENHSFLIGDVMPLYEKGDPVSEAHANALLSYASNQFHDATRSLEVSEHGIVTSGVDQSKVKLNMRNALMLENKFRVANNQEPLAVDLKKFDTASVHERSNAVERFASQRARWFLAPMIAASHIGTGFNPFLAAPLESVSKGLADMNNGEIKELSDAAAIFTSQHFHMMTEDMSNETNLLATKTGMPEVGRLYGQIFHNPGFNFIRNAQLKAAAAIGFHATGYWAEKAAKGDRMAAIELKGLRLDPSEIIKRGGQLTRAEKIRAIYEFTNQRVFISRPFDRSLNATKNPWMRMLTMFHGYVSSQQRFMRRELQKKVEGRDYVGLAVFAAKVGIMLPAIAPMLKAAEVFARTANASQTVAGVQSDYAKLSHPENIAQFSAEYLDMLSYFGSWGMLHSYINASHGDRLALALMGPIAGDAVRTTQDAINIITKPTKSGKHNIKPLAKDILQQTVPGAGNIIANQIFPAKDINN